MKKEILGFIIGLIFVLGCEQGPPQPQRLGPKEIISIEPHHATRIFITYRDGNGQIYTETIHQSNKFRCGDVTVDPHDYLRSYKGSMPYGKFDAVKYQEYRNGN